MTRPQPPTSVEQLLRRARALEGQTLRQVAETLDLPPPRNARHCKGWIGTLVEMALGADAGSRPEPDFTTLGIELKTVPLNRQGRPRESTYVCTVPLDQPAGLRWEASLVRRKLAQVLWMPLQADPYIPFARRRFLRPLLWQPSAAQEAVLRRDWEELMEHVVLGQLDRISARLGDYLQIRPKAANARAQVLGSSASGERIATLPRGFYLRASFTAGVLAQVR